MRAHAHTTRLAAAVLAAGTLAVLAGCAGDGSDVADGADRSRVAVPDAAIDPPSATIALRAVGDGGTLAEASQPGTADGGVLPLLEPRLRGTAVGEDGNEGVARVRVSITQRARCQAGDGRPFVRRRVRYYPPPQVERIRSRPGARLPIRRARSRVLALATAECGRGSLIGIDGQLWGEAINGSGLEAVTPHIHFRYRR